jgi:hypothetical protein
MTLAEIISTLEADDHGSMAMDWEIWRCVAGEDASALDLPPPYTVSLDAAIRLAPDGAWLNLGHRRDRDTQDKVCSAGFDVGQSPYGMYACAATLPLAMCLAALKWRAAITSSQAA